MPGRTSLGPAYLVTHRSGPDRTPGSTSRGPCYPVAHHSGRGPDRPLLPLPVQACIRSHWSRPSSGRRCKSAITASCTAFSTQDICAPGRPEKHCRPGFGWLQAGCRCFSQHFCPFRMIRLSMIDLAFSAGCCRCGAVSSASLLALLAASACPCRSRGSGSGFGCVHTFISRFFVSTFSVVFADCVALVVFGQFSGLSGHSVISLVRKLSTLRYAIGSRRTASERKAAGALAL